MYLEDNMRILGEQIKEQMKGVEEKMRGIFGSPSESRSNVITTRIGDNEMNTINMLLEAGLFNTLSEVAAFLIFEGIKSRKNDLGKVSSELEKIKKIRRETEERILKLKKDIGIL
jgi:hypothetical protein